jgi:CheY-like chemotaxis protein
MSGKSPLGRPVRVLIADDYPDSAASIAMFLSNAGVETCIASDGEQALIRALDWRPHICVLDVDMPRLNGNEVARRIREQQWAERPLLIAVTGWVNPSNRQTALAAGFDHWVGKPFDPLGLVQLIQDYVSASPAE